MYGRFTQAYTWHELVALYRLTQAAANLQPHYNIVPTDRVDVVTMRDGKAELAPMRCALPDHRHGRLDDRFGGEPVLDRVGLSAALDASVVQSANASVPSCTPADFPADVADGGSGHADTFNSCPKRSATEGHLRDYALRLMNRRRCHCFGRCCDG